MPRLREVFDQGDESLTLPDEDAKTEIGHNHPRCAGCVEMGETLEQRDFDFHEAQEKARYAEMWATEVNDKYNRLRKSLSALILETR